MQAQDGNVFLWAITLKLLCTQILLILRHKLNIFYIEP
jgi:hypothetical protein